MPTTRKTIMVALLLFFVSIVSSDTSPCSGAGKGAGNGTTVGGGVIMGCGAIMGIISGTGCCINTLLYPPTTKKR